MYVNASRASTISYYLVELIGQRIIDYALRTSLSVFESSRTSSSRSVRPKEKVMGKRLYVLQLYELLASLHKQ